MTRGSRPAGAGTAPLLAALCALAAWCGVPVVAADEVALVGRAAFPDRRDPPPWRELSGEERQRFDLGRLVFNTPWVQAGREGAGRRDGLGPQFIAASCDNCHNNGARGRGTDRSDALPSSFVMQLAGPGIERYGHVLAPQALAGIVPEGSVQVERIARHGRHADGDAWVLHEPRYRIVNLGYGDLPPDTVLGPRIAPALFGTGLLEAVPDAAIAQWHASQPRALRGLPGGRFNWLGDAHSLEEQTARAYAREMGITSAREPRDDCTSVQHDCLAAPDGGSPEVSAEFFDAVVAYQRALAVPSRPAPLDPRLEQRGRQLFGQAGCATCHRPLLPVDTAAGPARIDAYTDLLRHDLGPALADRTLSGSAVATRWRTAPLWGLSHALAGGEVALLHDGRARSLEEAILWHGGQADRARQAFTAMPRADRQDLLAWLGTL